MGESKSQFTAFVGGRCIAAGELPTVALAAKQVHDRDKWAQVLIFDDATSETIEVDFRGTDDEVLERIEKFVPPAVAKQAETTVMDKPPGPRGPGRPKLGVVAREITLLPRHWEWLGNQPGGASVTLRKLVENARRANEKSDHLRRSREVVYKFLSVMAGNLPDYEEVTRALFAGNHVRFYELIEPWPADIRDHVRKISAVAFDAKEESEEA